MIRFIEGDDNDISLLTLTWTICDVLGEADQLSLTAVCSPKSVLVRENHVASGKVVHYVWHWDAVHCVWGFYLSDIGLYCQGFAVDPFFNAGVIMACV